MNDTHLEVRVRETLNAVAAATPIRTLPEQRLVSPGRTSIPVWVALGFAATFVIGASLYAWLGPDSTPDAYGQGEGCIEAPPDHNWHFEMRDTADIDPGLLYLPSYLPVGFAVDYAWATDGVLCSRVAGPAGERLLPTQTWYLEDAIEDPPGDRDTKLLILIYHGNIDDYYTTPPNDPSPGLPSEPVSVGGREGLYILWDGGKEIAWQIAPYVVAVVHVQAPGSISLDELVRVAESLEPATPERADAVATARAESAFPYLGLDLAGWEFWRASESDTYCSDDPNPMPGAVRQAVYTFGPVAADQHPLLLGISFINLNVAPASTRCSFSEAWQSAGDLGPPPNPPAVIDHGMATVMGREGRIVEELGIFTVFWLLDDKGSVASLNVFPGDTPLTVEDVVAITDGVIELSPAQWAELIADTPDTPPDTTP